MRPLQYWLHGRVPRRASSFGIPGLHNHAADELMETPNPQMVQLIWRHFGEAQKCPTAALYGCTCIQLAAGPAQTLCKIREDEEQALLVAPYWSTWTCSSLADSSEEGSTDSERGHPMAPTSRPLETTCLVPGWDAEVLGDLPQGVVDTTTLARAQSMTHAYALKWNLFVKTPGDALLESLTPSTLKVYVAAIAAHHDRIEGKSVGKHDLVIRLNPPQPPSVLSWDLSLVLTALWQAP
ncbi:hypothetical protein M9458_017179, partial [Cirrhinus mrigala]